MRLIIIREYKGGEGVADRQHVHVRMGGNGMCGCQAALYSM
jgi:hypothetical protein